MTAAKSDAVPLYEKHIFGAHTSTKNVKGKRRRRRNPETGLLEEPPDDEAPAETQQAEAADEQTNDHIEERNKNEMQVLELHGESPYIMLDGQLYGCKWAEALGTDMIFTRKPDQDDTEAPGPNRKVLRSLQDWDLTGLGAARLLASKAHVEKRVVNPDPKTTTDSTANEQPINPRDTAQETSRSRQAAFLDRLKALRIKKGQVPEQSGQGTSTSQTQAPATPATQGGDSPSLQRRPSRGRGSRGGRPRGRGRGRGRGFQRALTTRHGERDEPQTPNIDDVVDPALMAHDADAMDQT